MTGIKSKILFFAIACALPALMSAQSEKSGMSVEEAIAVLNHGETAAADSTLTKKQLRKKSKEAKKAERRKKRQQKELEQISKTAVSTDTTHVTNSDSTIVAAKQSDQGSTFSIDGLSENPDSLGIPGAEYYTIDDSLMMAEGKALKNPPPPSKKSASHAAFLSALVPGLGQIYGGSQWWMAPVFWGGLTGTIYAASYYNSYYNDFRNEYKYRINNPGKVNSYEYFDTNALVDRMQYAEQTRDLWILGTVGVYLLNVLHANVSVQLSEFRAQKKHRQMLEMKEKNNAVISFEPAIIEPNKGLEAMSAPGMKLTLSF